jgi:D-alanine--poly(phosphoribitol) ligase subunit 2
MDRNERVATIIREVCSRDELLADLPADEDFFDHGVSSLAVIQMQIRIEEALKVIVPTSELMSRPTINDWIDLYTESASTSAGIIVPAGSSVSVAQ